jgi:hypothetical protein
MGKILTFAVAFGLLLSVSAPALASDHDPSPPAPFTYTPPSGWSMEKVPGFEYKFAMGKEVSGFKPNINVVAEDYSGSVESYMGHAKKTLMNVLGGKLSIISESEFVTDSGLKGAKMVFIAGHSLDEKYLESLKELGASEELRKLLKESSIDPKTLYQSSYVFSDGERVYIATCSAPVELKAEMSPVFDTAMRSFALNKKGAE